MNLSSETAKDILRISQESRYLHRSLRRWWSIHEAQKNSFLVNAAENHTPTHQDLTLMIETQQNLIEMSQHEIDSQLQTIHGFRDKLLSASTPM